MTATKQFQMIVNEEQARIMCKALDVFARIACGQFDVAIERVFGFSSDKVSEPVEMLRAALFPDIPKYAPIDVHRAGDPACIAFDIHHVIHRHLALEERGWPQKSDDPMIEFLYDEPLAISEQPLPRMETINEGVKNGDVET